MDIQEFAKLVRDRSPMLDEQDIRKFETLIGENLPTEYREFLLMCNGGRIGGIYYTQEGEFRIEDNLWYGDSVGVEIIGGLRKEPHFSLVNQRERYQSGNPPQIPLALIWIMSGPFGNAICLGINGKYKGKIYFWDHEQEPDPTKWDGTVETSNNLFLIADTYKGFIEGLSWDPKT